MITVRDGICVLILYWVFSILAVLSLLPAAAGTPVAEESPPVEGTQVGNVAPDFELKNLDGETVTLSELRGNPVMLNFWATWCGPCRAEMPHIQAVFEDEEWQDKGLVILAINLTYSRSSETPAAVKDFMQSHNFSFPVLLDTNRDVTLEYDVTGIPTTFFIDKDGIIQKRKLGAFSSKADIENSLKKIIP